MNDLYNKKQNVKEMKKQIISFALMIFLTCMAFVMVSMKLSVFVVYPILILFAVIQVLFQLYYFMHLKDEGNSLIPLFLFSGIFAGLVIIGAFTTIIWL